MVIPIHDRQWVWPRRTVGHIGSGITDPCRDQETGIVVAQSHSSTHGEATVRSEGDAASGPHPTSRCGLQRDDRSIRIA
jgi:hypothetical protein